MFNTLVCINNHIFVMYNLHFINDINPLFDRKRHIPCLLHVLNLEIQDDLKELKAFVEEDSSTLCISSSQFLRDVVTRVRKIVKVIQFVPSSRGETRKILS